MEPVNESHKALTFAIFLIDYSLYVLDLSAFILFIRVTNAFFSGYFQGENDDLIAGCHEQAALSLLQTGRCSGKAETSTEKRDALPLQHRQSYLRVSDCRPVRT